MWGSATRHGCEDTDAGASAKGGGKAFQVPKEREAFQVEGRGHFECGTPNFEGEATRRWSRVQRDSSLRSE